MIDPTLISAIKKRDNEAFKILYNNCIGYVFSIVRRYISNESEYQDVIQEIFARVFLSIGTFDASKGEFKYWLRRLVINQCLQSLRKSKSFSFQVPIDSINEELTAVEENFSELTPAEIENYLKKMPAGYRQIFMLVVIDEYSHKEVGKLLNISAATSRSQLLRAKKWLKKNFFENQQKNLIIGF